MCISDRLPVVTGTKKLIGARNAKPSEFWCALLEAFCMVIIHNLPTVLYAVLFRLKGGGYSQIVNGGSPREVFELVFNCRSTLLFVVESNIRSLLIDELKEARGRNVVVICGTEVSQIAIVCVMPNASLHYNSESLRHLVNSKTLERHLELKKPHRWVYCPL